jgi:phytoene dehydrogenase-like protein
MSKPYDIIIVGGGHNGLTAAAYLAQAGRSVLVLERRDWLGGAAATEPVFPGFQINSGAHDAGLFSGEIIEELNLTAHGLSWLPNNVAVFAPQPDGRALTLFNDPRQSMAEIRRFNGRDADQFPAFVEQIALFKPILQAAMQNRPPDLENLGLADLRAWAPIARQARGLKQELMSLLRLIPLSAAEFLNEWFESEALKGALGGTAVIGNGYGPQAQGTMFNFLYQRLGADSGGFMSSRFVKGGIGSLSAALAAAAEAQGAEVRRGTAVAKIEVNDGRAVGVLLANGERLEGQIIVSNLDARHTLFGLVGAGELEPRAIRRLRAMRYRGATAKLNLALSGLPHFNGQPDDPAYLGGHIFISPSLDYLERAADGVKYGRWAERPFIDMVIPTVLEPSLAPREVIFCRPLSISPPTICAKGIGTVAANSLPMKSRRRWPPMRPICPRSFNSGKLSRRWLGNGITA